jgi:hypothetical protein
MDHFKGSEESVSNEVCLPPWPQLGKCVQPVLVYGMTVLSWVHTDRGVQLIIDYSKG